MIDVKEVYLVNIEHQPKNADGSWNDDSGSSWTVNRFYNLYEADHYFEQYRNLETTRSIFLTVPTRSLDTPVIEPWKFRSNSDDDSENWEKWEKTKYKIKWKKTYYKSGTIEGSFYGENHAYEYAQENIDDWSGKLTIEHDPDYDELTIEEVT